MNKTSIDLGYLEEKAMNNLKEIVSVVETLKCAEAVIPANVFKDLEAGLWVTLHDATKLVALLNGVVAQQDWSDVDCIMESGREGLERVLYKYGYVREPDEMRKERERPAFARRILELSKGKRGPSRRAIYSEIERYGRDELTAHIEILLEGVTQNTKEWSQFQLEMQHLLPPLCTGIESNDPSDDIDVEKIYFDVD